MEHRNTVLKCIGRGADAYLVKPVLRKTLVAKIEEILKKYDAYKSNKTILMVDDDVEFLKISKAKLSKYYKVLTVNSSKTAMEYLTDHQVDLIVLVYFMPLYDGRSVLTILKKREYKEDTCYNGVSIVEGRGDNCLCENSTGWNCLKTG